MHVYVHALCRFLPWFLEAIPSEGCAKGGAGAYNNAVQKDTADPTGIAGLSHGIVTSSAFRTYHTPLNSQPDFINALKAAREFSETASRELGVQVRSPLICLCKLEGWLAGQTDTLYKCMRKAVIC